MDRNTSNVSFYCRESKKDRLGYAPIELSIIINKERCYIRLPRKEKPEEFKTLVNSKKPNDLKAYLDQRGSQCNIKNNKDERTTCIVKEKSQDQDGS